VFVRHIFQAPHPFNILTRASYTMVSMSSRRRRTHVPHIWYGDAKATAWSENLVAQSSSC
jgi:hypothetical protein